ncbi:hypothetical protein [Terasakiella sp.]|uniref:hypothetical protein n=1 Tax=Terasakiella sp. TaxID=2034861 RepID=UPI003AA7E122
MIDLLKRFQKAGRADISALLLIAFLFQLFTPIYLFAAEHSEQGEYEAALRNSICQVMLAEQQDDSLPTEQTDGFVCDWCLRGTFLPVVQLKDPALSVILTNPRITKITYKDTPLVLDAQVWGNIASSRAPPFSS